MVGRLTACASASWGTLSFWGFGVFPNVTYQDRWGKLAHARNFSAKAGYRYVYQDFEDDGLVWDMAMEGCISASACDSRAR
jgi:hypothetical protein